MRSPSDWQPLIICSESKGSLRQTASPHVPRISEDTKIILNLLGFYLLLLQCTLEATFETELVGVHKPDMRRQLNPPRKQRPLKPVLRSTKVREGR